VYWYDFWQGILVYWYYYWICKEEVIKRQKEVLCDESSKYHICIHSSKQHSNVENGKSHVLYQNTMPTFGEVFWCTGMTFGKVFWCTGTTIGFVFCCTGMTFGKVFWYTGSCFVFLGEYKRNQVFLKEEVIKRQKEVLCDESSKYHICIHSSKQHSNMIDS
jgi:hypothetical protein